MITAVPAKTIHVVTLPQFLHVHGVGYLFNTVVGNKQREVVWTKALADLVDIFCSFSESKCAETSLAANQHFVSLYMHILASREQLALALVRTVMHST